MTKRALNPEKSQTKSTNFWPKIELSKPEQHSLSQNRPLFGCVKIPKIFGEKVRVIFNDKKLLDVGPNISPNQEEGYLYLYLSSIGARYMLNPEMDIQVLLDQGEIEYLPGVKWIDPHDPVVSVKDENCLFSYIDLFSGIGGFAIGLKEMGGECVLASDIAPQARDTYEANFGHAPLGNLRRIDDDVFMKDATILTGGFPCQSFTKTGDQVGLTDVRGELFFEILRVLRCCQPKSFVLENVAGLIEMDDGDTLRLIMAELQSCGYHVSHNLYDCSSVIAQTRIRIFLIGIRSDQEEAIERFEWPVLPVLNPVVADILDYDLSENEIQDLIVIENQWENISRRGDPNNRIHNLEEPSNTIISHYRRSPTFHSKFIAVEGSDRPRFLSIPEVRRIQGFPESFKFVVKEKNRAYAFLGNAVPPPVAAAITQSILVAMDTITYDPELITKIAMRALPNSTKYLKTQQ